jgi:transcriptional regulator with XRE-family HTH domain
MKLKKFDDYLKKRLNKDEISDIEHQASLEAESLLSLQEDVSKAVAAYMAEKDIGFNELVRRLDTSSSQVLKIQKGEANLTLASIAHLAALLNKEPHIVFREHKA